ncbi:MAG: N-acetyl-gamma-glutamyl-phosphate reductase [Bacillota bacterium]
MSHHQLRVAIAGATGYTGLELLRILAGHPGAKVIRVTSQAQAGAPLAEACPHLRGLYDLTLEPLDRETIAADADVVFACLHTGEAPTLAPPVLGAGATLIDLGPDFRLKDPGDYAQWYGQAHAAPALLPEAVYGLSELARPQLPGAKLIANPGCYPTACLLALAPLAAAGLVARPPVLDCKSGVSGAGRVPTARTHFCEVHGTASAYGLPRHRHTPEIEQGLKTFGCDLPVSFTPHLLPMGRGILATVYVDPGKDVDAATIAGIYQDFYAGSPCIRLKPPGQLPTTGDVLATNFCDLGSVWDDRTGRIVAVTAIDNLGKGAAGQAIQNMNLAWGLPELTGLLTAAPYGG